MTSSRKGFVKEEEKVCLGARLLRDQYLSEVWKLETLG